MRKTKSKKINTNQIVPEKNKKNNNNESSIYIILLFLQIIISLVAFFIEPFENLEKSIKNTYIVIALITFFSCFFINTRHLLDGKINNILLKYIKISLFIAILIIAAIPLWYYFEYDFRKENSSLIGLNIAASQGNSNAALQMAYILKNKNDKNALKWFHLASANNCEEAQYELGLLYYKGIFTPIDEKKAIEFLSEAESNGNTNASYYLGCIYEKKEEEKALTYWLKAANKNNIFAQLKLGKYWYHKELQDSVFIDSNEQFGLTAKPDYSESRLLEYEPIFKINDKKSRPDVYFTKVVNHPINTENFEVISEAYGYLLEIHWDNKLPEVHFLPLAEKSMEFNNPICSAYYACALLKSGDPFYRNFAKSLLWNIYNEQKVPSFIFTLVTTYLAKQYCEENKFYFSRIITEKYIPDVLTYPYSDRQFIDLFEIYMTFAKVILPGYEYRTACETAANYLSRNIADHQTYQKTTLALWYLNPFINDPSYTKKAESILKKVIEYEPDNIMALITLAEIYQDPKNIFLEKNDSKIKNIINKLYNKSLTELYSIISHRKDTGKTWYFLGKIYESYKYDYLTSIKCYKNALKLGNNDAIMPLINIYKNDAKFYDGYQDITDHILYLYNKAANSGNAEALYELGLLYFDNNDFVEKNYSKSYTFFYEAVKKGSIEAMFMLSLFYSEGIIVSKDEEEAEKWHRHAASYNHTSSLYKIACSQIEKKRYKSACRILKNLIQKEHQGALMSLLKLKDEGIKEAILTYNSLFSSQQKIH